METRWAARFVGAEERPSLLTELPSMFHLFSHCWSWLQAIQEPIRKVTLLVVGLDNAGKTSIVMDIERALASEVLPVAQPGQTRLRVDRFEVTLVDLPGGSRSRSAWRSHYRVAHGLLFVLDSSDLARMEEARKVLSRVVSHPDVSGKPILLLANKQDAATALLPCELIERLALERDPPPPGEGARDGAGKTEEDRPLRPVRRLLPLEERTRGPGRRKRKAKVRKKGSGQPSPAEEPEGPGGGGDSRTGAAGGLLPSNRVGQEEPVPTRTATPHPAQGMKKKKKKKIKNKIKSQEPAMEQQYLYRRVMLALKMRQEQRKQQSAIVP
ncbi:PREDICTED: ADP-ribosylation factor-like protein 13A [Nipponia nippon]|uniref:ADP-ribosylation factor-like protein 13A n=1 Tax=Nipponia nippon TaxID=128390 RepID=UPI000510FA21|nr:PREDICTED: ADP-ribosylation factor-like protein 13A [Nipponia nippon]